MATRGLVLGDSAPITDQGGKGFDMTLLGGGSLPLPLSPPGAGASGGGADLGAWTPSWSYDPKSKQFGFNGVSGNPSLSVGAGQGSFTTQQAAEDYWLQQHPEYQPYAGDVGSAPVMQDVQGPQGYNDLAGNGAPTLGTGPNVNVNAGGAGGASSSFEQALLGSPDQIAGAQPLPFSAFGDIPTIAPTFATPGQIDPSQVGAVQGATVARPGTMPAAQIGDPGAMRAARVADVGTMGAATVDPAQAQAFTDQYDRQLRASLQPAFDTQMQDLNESMAARGIFNTSSAEDQATRLRGQQGAALAQGELPIIQQGFGAAQQDVLANQGAREQGIATTYQTAAQRAAQNAELAQQARATTYGTRAQTGAENAQLRQQAAGETYGTNAAADITQAQLDQQAGLTSYDAYQKALLENAQNAQQANLANADTANKASAANADMYYNTVLGDMNNYNAFDQALLGYGSALGGSELGAYLGSYTPSGSAIGILGQGAGAAEAGYNAGYRGYNGSGITSAITNAFARPSAPATTTNVGIIPGSADQYMLNGELVTDPMAGQ